MCVCVDRKSTLVVNIAFAAVSDHITRNTHACATIRLNAARTHTHTQVLSPNSAHSAHRSRADTRIRPARLSEPTCGGMAAHAFSASRARASRSETPQQTRHETSLPCNIYYWYKYMCDVDRYHAIMHFVCVCVFVCSTTDNNTTAVV